MCKVAALFAALALASPAFAEQVTLRITARYAGFPMAIGEYAPWDNDYRGTFTKWLFKFAGHHPRVRMLVYYRSTTAQNAFSISHYPGARRKLRRHGLARRLQVRRQLA